MNKYRSHNCAELNEQDINKVVQLSGWLHRKRDHGNLLFIDLRDHYGVTQCVIENKNKFFHVIEKAKPESIIQINGKETILPLMGKSLLTNRSKFQYYTMTDKNSVKLPIVSRGKSSMNEYGVDELFNGDNVYVQGYDDTFKVTIYENNNIQYIPF